MTKAVVMTQLYQDKKATFKQKRQSHHLELRWKSDGRQIRCKPRLRQTNKQHLKEDLSQPLFSEYHVSQKAFNKAAEVNKHHFAYLIELV